MGQMQQQRINVVKDTKNSAAWQRRFDHLHSFSTFEDKDDVIGKCLR